MGILRGILSKIAAPEHKLVAQAFYQRYYMEVLEHVLSVVTDHNQVPFVGMDFAVILFT